MLFHVTVGLMGKWVGSGQCNGSVDNVKAVFDTAVREVFRYREEQNKKATQSITCASFGIACLKGEGADQTGDGPETSG